MENTMNTKEYTAAMLLRRLSDVANPAAVLKKELAKLKRQERKTEPYRTEWLSRIAGYELALQKLSA